MSSFVGCVPGVYLAGVKMSPFLGNAPGIYLTGVQTVSSFLHCVLLLGVSLTGVKFSTLCFTFRCVFDGYQVFYIVFYF